MNVDEVREYCLAKKATSEDFPFGEDTLVFRVGNKIFALLSLDSTPLSINLKCEPQLAEELREQYHQVLPGYHMNKKHWNTVVIDHFLDADVLRKMIDHSYYRVVAGLPKAEREKLR